MGLFEKIRRTVWAVKYNLKALIRSVSTHEVLTLSIVSLIVGLLNLFVAFLATKALVWFGSVAFNTTIPPLVQFLVFAYILLTSPVQVKMRW